MQEFQSSRPDLPYCTSVNNEGLADGKCWDPIILVKAKSGSRYRNLVDVIDEISLLNLKYALGQFTSADSLLIEEDSVNNGNHVLAELQIQ